MLASKSKEHKTLGMTYNLEIESVTIDTLEAECHTQLLERESAVQQRKNKGKKGSKRAAPAAEGEEEEEEEDLRLPAASGSLATTAESGSAAKRAKLERAAAAQKRKADQAEAKQAALWLPQRRALLPRARLWSGWRKLWRLPRSSRATRTCSRTRARLRALGSCGSFAPKLLRLSARRALASLSWSMTSTWTLGPAQGGAWLSQGLERRPGCPQACQSSAEGSKAKLSFTPTAACCVLGCSFWQRALNQPGEATQGCDRNRARA